MWSPTLEWTTSDVTTLWTTTSQCKMCFRIISNWIQSCHWYNICGHKKRKPYATALVPGLVSATMITALERSLTHKKALDDFSGNLVSMERDRIVNLSKNKNRHDEVISGSSVTAMGSNVHWTSIVGHVKKSNSAVVLAEFLSAK